MDKLAYDEDEEIDDDKLSWNEPLTLTKEVVGGGAGWMASKPLGSRFPTHEVATEMIRGGDTTATNLLGSTAITSWRPVGARPTAPRTVMVGIKAER